MHTPKRSNSFFLPNPSPVFYRCPTRIARTENEEMNPSRKAAVKIPMIRPGDNITSGICEGGWMNTTSQMRNPVDRMWWRSVLSQGMNHGSGKKGGEVCDLVRCTIAHGASNNALSEPHTQGGSAPAVTPMHEKKNRRPQIRNHKI